MCILSHLVEILQPRITMHGTTNIKWKKALPTELLPPACCPFRAAEGWFWRRRNIISLAPRTLFFFFHWHYSPLWALACRTMSFHFFLSAINSLHLLTPSTWRSLSTSSFHLFLVLPLLLVHSVLEWSSFWASYSPQFSLGDLTSLSFAWTLLGFWINCQEGWHFNNTL